MSKLFFVMMTFFFWRLASAYECENFINAELKKLGMGTMNKQELCVNKNTQEPAVGFYRSSKDPEFVQSVQVDNVGGKKTVIVRSPSINLSGLDSKEITLNNSCEIEAIQFCFGGDCARFTADVCEKISDRLAKDKNRKGLPDLYKQLPGAKKWGVNPTMSDAVENFCLYRYKGQFQAGSKNPTATSSSVIKETTPCTDHDDCAAK